MSRCIVVQQMLLLFSWNCCVTFTIIAAVNKLSVCSASLHSIFLNDYLWKTVTRRRRKRRRRRRRLRRRRRRSSSSSSSSSSLNCQYLKSPFEIRWIQSVVSSIRWIHQACCVFSHLHNVFSLFSFKDTSDERVPGTNTVHSQHFWACSEFCWHCF